MFPSHRQLSMFRQLWIQMIHLAFSSEHSMNTLTWTFIQFSFWTIRVSFSNIWAKHSWNVLWMLPCPLGLTSKIFTFQSFNCNISCWIRLINAQSGNLSVQLYLRVISLWSVQVFLIYKFLFTFLAEDGATVWFYSNVGVRQVENLSHLLVAIFCKWYGRFFQTTQLRYFPKINWKTWQR